MEEQARAGAKGTAFSFCDAEEKEYLRDIEKLIAQKIPVVENHPFPLIDHNPVKVSYPPFGEAGTAAQERKFGSLETETLRK
ncbi:MAG: hypothetical protein MZV64_03575 [Ignavibacteriales bacterium]|nr:hypothetical protein [Ignavibacteriales bacterium]